MESKLVEYLIVGALLAYCIFAFFSARRLSHRTANAADPGTNMQAADGGVWSAGDGYSDGHSQGHGHEHGSSDGGADGGGASGGGGSGGDAGGSGD